VPDPAIFLHTDKNAQRHRSHIMDRIAQLGGTYSSSFDVNSTHLLCTSDKPNDPSRDFRAAKSTNRFVCHPEWLQACLNLRKRVDERMYPHTYKPGRALSLTVVKDEDDVASPGRVTSLDEDDAVDLPPPLKMPTISPSKEGCVPTTTIVEPDPERCGDQGENVTAEFDNAPASPPIMTREGPAEPAGNQTLLLDPSLAPDITGDSAVNGDTCARASATPSPSPHKQPAAEGAQISNELADQLLQKLWQSSEDNPKLVKVSTR
jgi:hypothetical protein